MSIILSLKAPLDGSIDSQTCRVHLCKDPGDVKIMLPHTE